MDSMGRLTEDFPDNAYYEVHALGYACARNESVQAMDVGPEGESK